MDVGGAQWDYDTTRKEWVFGWKNSDGSVTPASGRSAGGGSDSGSPGYVAEAIKQTEQDAFGAPSNGGSGGGLPLGGKAAALPAIAKVAIPTLAMAAGRSLTGGGNSGTAAPGMPPELQQLLAMAMRRMTEQEPLSRAVNAQAYAGLPTAYKQG
jgi:hypothetical protein